MKPYLIPISTLLVGLLIGFLIFRPAIEATHEHSDTEQVWTCSMHPNIRQNTPGSCPLCGMDLIPATGSATDTDLYTHELSPQAVALADIRTVEVASSGAEATIALPGRVVVNDGDVHRLTSFIDGRVTREFAGYEGASVRKGQELLRIVSPDVATAWSELRTEGLSNQAVVTRLRYWGLTDAQIAELRAAPSAVQEIALLAPTSGVVTMRDVRPGSLVMPGMVLYEIADLSSVWVEFDALEGDVAGVGAGTAVTYTVDAIPGQSFRGTVSFVSPTVDAMSRRISLRIEVPNPSGTLKPDMLVRGQLRTKGSTGLRVPASAVLWTGPRSVVYVKLDGESPTFQLREVTLGGKSGDTYLITSGLQAGERVVVNGAFTVDAEFQLAGKASMMNRPQTASTSAVENTDLKPLVDAYLPLKDALLASDAAKALAAVKGMLAVADAQPLRDATWNALRTEVIAQLRGWEREPGLEAQRTRFRKLSDTMRGGLDAFGAGRPIAVQFCPMAFSNTGARWLSASEIIENPYLPETMLGCGEVISKR